VHKVGFAMEDDKDDMLPGSHVGRVEFIPSEPDEIPAQRNVAFPEGEGDPSSSSQGQKNSHDLDNDSEISGRPLSDRPSHFTSADSADGHLSLPKKDSSRLRGKSFLVQTDREQHMYQALAEQTQHMYSSPRGLLDPRKRFMQRWDVYVAILLLFTAVVTPFEVSFLDIKQFWNPLYLINRVVDLSFMFDVLLQFNLMYIDSKTNSWVTGRWRIAKNYLLGSFFIDFVSVLPFDTIGMVMEVGSIKKLKILRILRLLRLFKLLRIIRSGRVFRRLEGMLNMGYAMQTLLKFIFGTLAIAHWMACAWMLVAVIEANCMNWVIKYFGDVDHEGFCDELSSETCNHISFCDEVPEEICESDFGLTCDNSRSDGTCCGAYSEVSAGSAHGSGVGPRLAPLSRASLIA